MHIFKLLHINEQLPHGKWNLVIDDSGGYFLTNAFSDTCNNKRKREREVRLIADMIIQDDFFNDEYLFTEAVLSITWLHERYDEDKNDGYTHIDLRFNNETMVWFMLKFRGEFLETL